MQAKERNLDYPSWNMARCEESDDDEPGPKFYAEDQLIFEDRCDRKGTVEAQNATISPDCFLVSFNYLNKN